MKLKRFLNNEEFLTLKTLATKKELIKEKAYGKAEKNIDTEIITNILKDIIEGFNSFSSFVDNEKIRLDYNWNYEDKNQYPFYGVGYITIEELKNGF